MQNSIYLDFNATTPVDPRVLEAMIPYFNFQYGNPASQLHSKGWEAKAAVESSRERVAALIGASPQEICFTMGSTESNNWALKGLIDFLQDEKPNEPVHVLTSNIEHASVREPLLYLQRKGQIELDLVPVDSEGLIRVETLEKYRKPHTQLLSLIWVHNEIGSIQNVSEISQWAQKYGIYFHSDATQAVGKIEVNVQKIPISLLSFSGHKIYGPKGVGCLYIRGAKPKVTLRPLLHGGGQESLGRSGTLTVRGIVGIGVACELAKTDMKSDWQKA
jgi:cysteine desulfurase